MTAPPLAGIRVVDASAYVAGPTCGAILGSMGAEVIKVEPPGGDEFRNSGPFINGTSYPFQMLNHNKQSIVVDLKNPDGVKVVRELARSSDVFLQSWRPGTADRLGVGYDDLLAFNSRLIYCSISGFGQSGPYRDRGGVDIIAQAMGGLMGLTGEPGRPPVKVSYPITDIGASLWGIIGILAALTARHTTDHGQHVDVALLDSPVSWSIWEAAQYFGTGEVPRPIGSSHRNVAPYRAFECSDGLYIAVGVASQNMWQRLCTALDAGELFSDERFTSLNLRRENRETLEAALEGIFRKGQRQEWLQILEAAGIPAGPVYSYDEVLSDPQVKHRGLVTEIQHPVAGSMQVLDVPLFLSETPRQQMAPAPILGDSTSSVLRSAGFSDGDIDRLLASSAVY